MCLLIIDVLELRLRGVEFKVLVVGAETDVELTLEMLVRSQELMETIHEQADEILEGFPSHLSTNGGNAVYQSSFVYALQNFVNSLLSLHWL
jgi:hypothetical protein